MKNKNFDIIGDIHGNFDALSRLLEKLNYTKDSDGVYFHSNRQVIFLGDYIDKGDEQFKVINIVKPMVESGSALAIIGNHEFNAICYHTNDPDTGKPFREHSKKNKNQHKAFLKEYKIGKKRTKEVIDWFKTLPLFIEMDKFKVIHACWDKKIIKSISHKKGAKYCLKSDNTMSKKFIKKASKKGTTEFDAVETLLKGLEIDLPRGNKFKDNYDEYRRTIRVKWWEDKADTYREYALVPKHAVSSISTNKLPKNKMVPAYTGKEPVFFGHYWFSGKPKILKNNIACLDYSVAHKEKLVCYQWNKGDKTLSNKNFAFVDASLSKK